jgi:hypothetical protein
MHSNQTFVADGARMNHREVTNGYFRPDDCWQVIRHVNHCAVLNVRTFAN